MSDNRTTPASVHIDGGVFTYEEPNGVGDNLEATSHGGGITITIEEPWAGDTETGFGYKTSIRMDPHVAAAFAAWLTEQANV